MLPHKQEYLTSPVCILLPIVTEHHVILSILIFYYENTTVRSHLQGKNIIIIISQGLRFTYS